MKTIKNLALATVLALASLTAAAGPTITNQPVSAVVTAGQPASLSVTAGPAPTAYFWTKDGVILPDQTNATLSFSAFQFTNSGNYQVAISNASGLTICLPASLSLTNAPLRGWGYDDGELGSANGVILINQPKLVRSNVVVVAAGTYDTMYITADGTLWALGNNNYGQLGTGVTGGTTKVPVLVSSNVVSAATSGTTSLFVKSDGTLWSMGDNSYGQLGVPATVVSTNLPAFVTNNVVAVAVAGADSLFLKSDGTLWGMGINYSTQLGSGASSISKPVKLASGVVTMAGGNDHILFVKANQTLWTIGSNYKGLLGIGSAVLSTNVPILVASNVVGAASGVFYSLFITADHKLWAFGDNTYGQFGGGLTVSQTNIPVLVASNVVAASAVSGQGSTLFIKENGSLWTVGDNEFGLLGIGSSVAATNVPVQVTQGGLVAASLAMAPNSYIAYAVAGEVPALQSLTNLSVSAGQSFSFNATITNGDGPFTYQWQRGGTNINGATSATYSVATASTSDNGLYTVLVASPYGSGGASASFTLQAVSPATVTVNNLSQVYAGTARPVTVTTIPAGLSNSISYNGSPNAPTNAGGYTVIALVTDASYTGGATNLLIIAPATQIITNFVRLPDAVIGDAPFTVSAMASSGLPVSFASATPSVAAVSGNSVSIVATGSATITASQAGNGNYQSAASVSQMLVVQPFVIGLAIQGGPATNGRVSTAILTLTGNTNRPYSIHYITDLTQTNWQVLQTVSLPVSPYQVTVPVLNQSYRFYRLSHP